MSDRILRSFLQQQYEEGMALAAASDLLTLVPIEGSPPQRYVAEFGCVGLVCSPTGEIQQANRFVVGIWFPDDYLRHVEPFQVLTWLAPTSAWHPNISNRGPFVCPGNLVPGTPLVDVLYQLFEIITFNKVTMVETNALNHAACAWTRSNLSRLPVDTRPLKRRSPEMEGAAASTLDFEVVEVER